MMLTNWQAYPKDHHTLWKMPFWSEVFTLENAKGYSAKVQRRIQTAQTIWNIIYLVPLLLTMSLSGLVTLFLLFRITFWVGLIYHALCTMITRSVYQLLFPVESVNSVLQIDKHLVCKHKCMINGRKHNQLWSEFFLI